ncbi:MAG: CNNM domain-containing protein, partial [Pirellulales bacterium]
MNEDSLFWIAIGSMAAACLAAVAARSLHSFSRHDLEEIAQNRQKPKRFADILHHHDRVALGVEMVVALLVALSVCAGTVWAWQSFAATSSSPWLVFALAAIVLGQILAVLTVWLPWSIARIAAARFLFWTWPLWAVLGRLALPLVWIARAVDALLHRLAGRKPQ